VSEAADVAQESRRLLRRSRSAALATRQPDGRPYASLVTVAWDHDAAPLFLFSDLVEAASRRVNPQTGPRLSLVGRIAASDAARHRRRFLARHPDAQAYAGFADFAVYAMRVERAHWVGGFARARWIEARRLLLPEKAWRGVAACEEGVVDHMNDDHADAVDLFARVLLGRRGDGWRMTGIDPEGIDLALGGRHARLDFAVPVTDAATCRERLIGLVEAGRRADG
jgi:hypothetical protein